MTATASSTTTNRIDKAAFLIACNSLCIMGVGVEEGEIFDGRRQVFAKGKPEQGHSTLSGPVISNNVLPELRKKSQTFSYS
jgi:hypothetical protein